MKSEILMVCLVPIHVSNTEAYHLYLTGNVANLELYKPLFVKFVLIITFCGPHYKYMGTDVEYTECNYSMCLH